MTFSLFFFFFKISLCCLYGENFIFAQKHHESILSLEMYELYLMCFLPDSRIVKTTQVSDVFVKTFFKLFVVEFYLFVRMSCFLVGDTMEFDVHIRSPGRVFTTWTRNVLRNRNTKHRVVLSQVEFSPTLTGTVICNCIENFP